MQESESTDDEHVVLSKAQSLLVLVILLFFAFREQPQIDVRSEARLLIKVWEVKNRLAVTGLYMDEELVSSLPDWRRWALVSAKRRTILAFHHLEYAWSLLNGYPPLTCSELGPLPAPSPGHVWRETDECTWSLLYDEWLHQWSDGIYKMHEFFSIQRGQPLDRRSEMWLAEADDYGMMLMAEGEPVLSTCH